MKKLVLLYAIVLCFICAGCGKGGESYTKGNINWDDLEGDQAASDHTDASIEQEISDAVSQRTSDDNMPDHAISVACHLCHGDGICYHCDGESFRDGRRCNVCNGTGNCDACEGIGSLEVIEVDGVDYIVCTGCHGSGDCGVCDGTGKIVHQYSTLGRVNRDCSLCHGSGNCVGCKGTGLRELAGF